jgi:hypothetical protein
MMSATLEKIATTIVVAKKRLRATAHLITRVKCYSVDFFGAESVL